MRTNILAIITLLIPLASYGMNYTIAFHQSVIDSTTYTDARINSTDNCVLAERKSEKISKANTGFGIKGGTASVKGQLTLQLDAVYHITNMTVYAAAYNNKNDTAKTKGMIICGDTIYWETNHKTEIRPYVISINQQTDSIYLSSIVSSNNRWNVQRIDFTADDPNPGAPKITSPISIDMGSAILEGGQPATDATNITILARGATDSLQLSLKKGTTFFLNTPKLSPNGGNINIAYLVQSASETGFTIKDSLIILATGEQQNLRRAIEVSLFTRNNPNPPAPVDSSCMRIGPMPGNYYQPAQGLKDSLLKDALSGIIHCGPRYRYGAGKHHSWNGFFFTDRDTTTQQVLDMYSNHKRYFNPTDTFASVSGLDIEHMFPKAWWGKEENDAYNDLFHLTPADYSANRSKSDNAPGIPADSTFNNESFVTGSGKAYGLLRVFCPADEYKGDFARAYFYIVTCYQELKWLETGDAAIAMTNTSYLEFRPWMQELLMSWHRLDPVSDKEKARAIEVNKIQGNRNPFIDYPELAEYIWGNKQGEVVNFYNLTQSYGDPYSEETSLPSTTSIHTESNPRKVLIGEQLYIHHNGVYYSILGF